VAYDRNLASINRKLLKGSEVLQDSIRERLGRTAPVSVLDIGCGVGVALMELAWMFRDEPVRFVGINKERGEPIASREDFLQTARQIDLASDDELAGLRLPELFFEDAAEMHFEDESFDVVYASSVLRFVPEKARFLEEVARVLKPGGVAIIRVGSKGWDYPFAPTTGTPELTSYGSRWVLKHRNELIPLEAFLALASTGGVRLELVNRPHCVVRLVKLRRGPLTLGLRYLPELSGAMSELGYGDEDRGLAKGGIRSVYEVSDCDYRSLLETGLLTPSKATADATSQSRRYKLEPAFVVAHAWRPIAATLGVIFYTAPMTACGATRALAHMHRFSWGGALLLGLLGAVLLPSMRKNRLSSYRVGQRVNVKGRRKGTSFRAAKIKMVRHLTADDHLEGTVESVDAARGTLALLGTSACASELVSGAASAIRLEEIKPGMKVRVRGTCDSGKFLASAVNMVAPSPILVEEIQGPIERLHPAIGTLQVAGITIVTDADTKIDRMDAR
jgi:SAM-dependent methyltransferase